MTFSTAEAGDQWLALQQAGCPGADEYLAYLIENKPPLTDEQSMRLVRLFICGETA